MNYLTMNLELTIIDYDPSLAVHFRDLNLAWLTKYFYVEAIDEEVLNNPQRHIIDKGGAICFVRLNGNIAGTFALIHRGDGVYELGKMAVDERQQGKGLGNALLRACFEKAERLGASKVILYSNTRLQPALHLYRKYGFREVPIGTSAYKRSDIKMERSLKQPQRLAELFRKKSGSILNVYCTAGYPSLGSTLPVMQSLQRHGADIIELGMPYSDPLADGPVIQASGLKALQNGMTISTLFTQLAAMRETVTIPVVLMGYLNPILQVGFEAFCGRAAAVGVDGLIIPDIPMWEYETQYRSIIEKHGLHFIFLVTPETSEERIRKLDALSSGFLYAVSSSSITGSDKDFTDVEPYLKRLKEMQLTNPVLVGFGIKDRFTFETACRYAQGGIIGSAYIKAIAEGSDIDGTTARFLQTIRMGEVAKTGVGI